MYREKRQRVVSLRLKPSFSLPFGPPWRLVTLKTSRRPTSRQNDLSTYWQGNAHNQPSIHLLSARESFPAYSRKRFSNNGTAPPPRESTSRLPPSPPRGISMKNNVVPRGDRILSRLVSRMCMFINLLLHRKSVKLD